MQADLRSRLEKLTAELVKAGEGAVSCVAVFGSVARDRYLPGTSDVNLIVVLNDAAPETLSRLSAPLREAYRSHRVEPMLISASEVKRAADVFPTKFMDIQRHHLVLHGSSPFEGLRVHPNHLRLRIEQELRNMLLRVRRRYIAAVVDRDRLRELVREVVPGFAVELAALAELVGKPRPDDGSLSKLLQGSAAAFGWDATRAELLARVHDESASGAEVERAISALIDLLERAVAIVDAHPEVA